MTHLEGLPHLYTFAEVAELVGKTERKLRADKKRFEHIEAARGVYRLTQDQALKVIELYKKRPTDDRSVARERDRARVMGERRRLPRQRTAA